MSGPIQVIPPGFLGFLQLKNFGRNPSDLPDQLSTVLEAFEWYMQARAERRTSTFDLATNDTGPVPLGSFTTTDLSVPANEIWYVISANVSSQTLPAAADFASLKVGYFDSNLGAFFAAKYLDGAGAPAGIAAADVRPIFSGSDFWVPAGGFISVWVQQAAFAGGPFTASVAARVVRMPL